MNGYIFSWLLRVGMCAAVMALAGDNARTSVAPAKFVTPTCEHALPHAFPGRSVSVDPKDGRIIPRPNQPQAALPVQAQNELNTSSEGLREVPGKTKSGGVKVHLQGRFRSAVSASLDSNGLLTKRCETDASSSTP